MLQTLSKTHLSQKLPEDLAQASSVTPMQDQSRDIGSVFAQLAQASPSEKSLSLSPTRLNMTHEAQP